MLCKWEFQYQTCTQMHPRISKSVNRPRPQPQGRLKCPQRLGHNKQPARATLMQNPEHDIPFGQNMPTQAVPCDHGNKPLRVRLCLTF